jgi:alkylation response protein AidB-like acyl-CoA dehydrogenase
VPKIQKAGLLKNFFKKPYGHGRSELLQGLLTAELARGDAGVATMVIVQCGLLGYTI